MRKVAIFTEGQTEQIFVRYLVGVALGWDKISIKCLRLCDGQMSLGGMDLYNQNADVHFQIIDVGGDERVLSVIKDRERLLVKQGFKQVIGLRDMYSEAYVKRADRKVANDVIQAFIEGAQQTVQQMNSPGKIALHFAIMEVEAWFLGMCKVFERIDAKLTAQYIAQELRFNLDKIDPQEGFLRPSDKVNQILHLVGRKYGKSRGDVEAICRGIEQSDVQAMLASGRCQSFRGLYADIISS